MTHFVGVLLLEHVELEAGIMQSVALDLQRLGEQVPVLVLHVFANV